MHWDSMLIEIIGIRVEIVTNPQKLNVMVEILHRRH